MSKKEFIEYCAKFGLQCRYEGKKSTMYVSGNSAAKVLKHFVKAKGFKIVVEDD